MLVSNSNKYSDSNIGFKNENILNAIMSKKKIHLILNIVSVISLEFHLSGKCLFPIDKMFIYQ